MYRCVGGSKYAHQIFHTEWLTKKGIHTSHITNKTHKREWTYTHKERERQPWKEMMIEYASHATHSLWCLSSLIINSFSLIHISIHTIPCFLFCSFYLTLSFPFFSSPLLLFTCHPAFFSCFWCWISTVTDDIGTGRDGRWGGWRRRRRRKRRGNRSKRRGRRNRRRSGWLMRSNPASTIKPILDQTRSQGRKRQKRKK